MAELVYDIDVNVRKALTGLDKLQRNVKKTNKAVEKSNKVFSKFKGILTTTAVVGFGMLIKKSLDAADALGKVANKTGFSIDALQELRYAAELAGMSTLQLDTSLQRFSRRVGEAGNGTGVLAKDLEALGIEFKNQDGSMRDINSVFMDYMGAIDGATNEQEKLRLAVAAFDMEGAQMVNMLQDGVSGFASWRAEASKLGIVLDQNVIDKATESNDAWLKVKKQFQAIAIIASAELAPAITKISKDLSNLLKDKDSVKALADSFKTLGDAIVWTWEHMDNLLTALQAYMVSHAAIKIMMKTGIFITFAKTVIAAKNAMQLFGSVLVGLRMLFVPLLTLIGTWGAIAAAIWGAYEAITYFIGASNDLTKDGDKLKQFNIDLDKTHSIMGRFKDVKLGDIKPNLNPSDADKASLEFLRELVKEPIKADTTEIKELRKDMEDLEGVIDPSIVLWKEYNKQVANVVKALGKGVINKSKATEFVQYLQDEFEASLNALEGFGDEVEAQADQAKTWAQGWQEAFKEYKESAFDAANNAKTIFNSVTQNMEDAIYNFAQTGKMNFKSFAQSVINDMLRIQSKKLAANIMGSAGSSLSNLFSGYFATGGVIPAGRYGVVGESGPEIVNGPANVSRAGGSNVTYNINAVDAPSFQSLLAQDPAFLFALTEQGRETLPSFS